MYTPEASEENISFEEARKRIFDVMKKRQVLSNPETVPLPKIPVPPRELYSGEGDEVQYCDKAGSSRAFGGPSVYPSSAHRSEGMGSIDYDVVVDIPRLDTSTPEPDNEIGQVIGCAEWRVMMQLISVRKPETTSLCRSLEGLDSFRPSKKANWAHHSMVVAELLKLGGPFLIQIFLTDYHELIKRVGPTTVVRSGERVAFAEGIPAELFYSRVKLTSPEEIHVLADKCEASKASVPTDKAVGLWRGTVSHYEMKRTIISDLVKRLSW